MTTAFWCVLVAALLPYLFTAVAKSDGFDNHAPRVTLQQLQGWRQRAHWAQLNGFEAFPAFAAAVLVHHLVRGPDALADRLAWMFVAARLLYGVCYVLDWALLRSVVWVASMACMIALFITAA